LVGKKLLDASLYFFLVKMFNITILVGKKLLDASLYFFLPSSANQ